MFKKLFGLEKKKAVPANTDAVRLGVDLEMSYCPKCNEEYRQDIEQCVHCQVPLISAQERFRILSDQEKGFSARSMEIAEGEPLVAIREGKLRDLKPYQVLLAKERIPALLNGGAGGCAKGWGGPDLQLEVRAADAKEAISILEKEYLATTGLSESDLQVADAVFDEHAATTVCPACNTSFVPSQSSECPECGLRFG